MPSLRQHLAEGAAQLAHAGIGEPRLTAEVLLAALLRHERSYLYAHPEQMLMPEEAARWQQWVEARAAGAPLQYLTGVQEFYGRPFAVTPAVLIPRPETELVVAAALQRVAPDAAPRILDAGTGSGCIAVTLALERPRSVVVASDLSRAALRVAADNARRLGARVRFLQSDLLTAVAGPLDVVVSNPPYVAERELAMLQIEVREHEPRLALVAGPSGDEFYARLIPQAARCLAPGGWLILELGYAAAGRVEPMFPASLWRAPDLTRDDQGWLRVLAAQKKV